MGKSQDQDVEGSVQLFIFKDSGATWIPLHLGGVALVGDKDLMLNLAKALAVAVLGMASIQPLGLYNLSL